MYVNLPNLHTIHIIFPCLNIEKFSPPLLSGKKGSVNKKKYMILT